MDHRKFVARPALTPAAPAHSEPAAEEPYQAPREQVSAPPEGPNASKFSLAEEVDFRVSGRLMLDAKRVPTLPGLGAASSRNDLDDVEREVRILESRALLMRAVHASGHNVTVRARVRPTQDAVRSSHTRVRSELDREPNLEITVSHAASPDLLQGTQRYRVCFVSESQYELWSGAVWLGLGTIDRGFVVARLRLKVSRAVEHATLQGSEYELELRPLHEVVAQVQRRLKVTVCSEPGAHAQVELAFAGESPARARALLRQLALAYLALRPAQEKRGPVVSLTLARPAQQPLTSAAAATRAIATSAPAAAIATPTILPNAARTEPPSAQQRTASAAIISLPRAQQQAASAFADHELEAAAQRFLPRRRPLGRWLAGAGLAALLLGQGAIALGKREGTSMKRLRPVPAQPNVASALAPIAWDTLSQSAPIPTVEPLHPDERTQATCPATIPRAALPAREKKRVANAPSNPEPRPASAVTNVFGPRDFAQADPQAESADILPLNPY